MQPVGSMLVIVMVVQQISSAIRRQILTTLWIHRNFHQRSLIGNIPGAAVTFKIACYCLSNAMHGLERYKMTCLSVWPKYISSTIATAVFLRSFSNLECRSHIWQRRLSSMPNNTGSSKRACALIYFRFSSLLGLPSSSYKQGANSKPSNVAPQVMSHRVHDG